MRLLLAEDEQDLNDAVSMILRKNNYTVDSVFNGREALDYLAVGEYDVVVMDIMMPVMNGLEALRTLRSRGDKTPVLLLTAKAELDDRVSGLDVGADDYLTKPFAVKELLARLRAISRRSIAGQADNCLTVGNTTLDKALYEIKGPNGSEVLGNREFQLMESFMRHPDIFQTAEVLYERIWGIESDAEISVVWANISNLRKKLRNLGSDCELKAKRNVGYRIEVLN